MEHHCGGRRSPPECWPSRADFQRRHAFPPHDDLPRVGRVGLLAATMQVLERSSPCGLRRASGDSPQASGAIHPHPDQVRALLPAVAAHARQYAELAFDACRLGRRILVALPASALMKTVV
jgi:hypothetical protein